MSFANFKSVLVRSLRMLTLVFACTLLMFSNAFPALAISSSPSNLSEGEAHLDDIQMKSEEILKRDPLNMEETQAEANKGINEIQGAGDANDMSHPGNSRQAKTAADRVTEALEKATGRD